MRKRTNTCIGKRTHREMNTQEKLTEKGTLRKI